MIEHKIVPKSSIAYFPGLKSSSYEHPEDRILLNAARAIPGFDAALKAMIGFGYEKPAYTYNVSSSIRVSPRQLPKLYRMYRRLVEQLDVSEPELFVYNDRNLNAYAAGVENPWIVLHAGLLEVLNEQEIAWVLAHELGHVKSGHVMYHTMARLLSHGVLEGIARLPIFGGLLQAAAEGTIIAALYRWQRVSELTADRAAHLVCGNVQLGIDVLTKLAGGYGWDEPVDVDGFLHQADDFLALDNELAGKIAMVMGGSLLRTHPYPVVRARALVEWNASMELQLIHNGQDQREVGTTSTVLPEDQHALVIADEFSVKLTVGTCSACAAPYDGGDIYCLSCGHRVNKSHFQK
jgi:Zn-dependent protease with chaperone function